MTWCERSDWLDLGSLSLNAYTLAGPWLSLGLHASLCPLYVDLHALWWVFSAMSRKRGLEIRGHEEAYFHDNVSFSCP